MHCQGGYSSMSAMRGKFGANHHSRAVLAPSIYRECKECRMDYYRDKFWRNGSNRALVSVNMLPVSDLQKMGLNMLRPSPSTVEHRGQVTII
jgi:hypothetical protein